MLALKKWWWKKRCPHVHIATRTWFDDGAVHRKTVCVECGETVPCPPIGDAEIMRLLEKARAAKHTS